jgi:hypothetical protein
MSVNIATLGMFGGVGYGGGGGPTIVGSGIPSEISRKEYAEFNKPSILVRRVEFGDKIDQQQLRGSIIVKSVK